MDNQIPGDRSQNSNYLLEVTCSTSGVLVMFSILIWVVVKQVCPLHKSVLNYIPI